MTVGRVLGLLGGAAWAMAGCQYSVCHFDRPTPEQVGTAVAKAGAYAPDYLVFAKTYTRVWPEEYCARLAEGKGGPVSWSVSKGFVFAFADGKDDVRLAPEAGGCRLEVRCETCEKGMPFYAGRWERDERRERMIIEQTYWRLKQADPQVTAKAEGEWQPGEWRPASQPASRPAP